MEERDSVVLSVASAVTEDVNVFVPVLELVTVPDLVVV